ncbi:hypothetical protein GWK48_06920 [Metallosphaera tengchongensis]|uniref:Uncharacterized protein n=1 Tax=Metallosphaera tengchongensis TaxID=1532350 RepID=A0A6N0NYC8_9CREN|nr:hypothetical protein [Metallosphaera tengchongensis]QKR00141.1 hypothetical protein GWK48_06920 [Metallosphaera tengchongensis]
MKGTRKGEKSKVTKWRILTIALALLLIFAGTELFYIHVKSGPVTIEVKGVSTINQIVAVNNNTLAFVGDLKQGNTYRGVLGEFFLGNLSYVLFNLGNYFTNGSVYSIAYNGSAFLLGGAQYFKVGNASVLVPETILYNDNKIINLTSLIPNIYTPGQVFSVSWQRDFWLIGGSSLVIQGSSKFQIPFLIKVFPNLNVSDVTSNLPSYFYQPLSVGSGIFTISSDGGSSFIGGTHLFNYTIALYDGESFISYPEGLGGIIASSFSPAGWIFGGFTYSLNDTQITLTLLGVLNGSKVQLITLKYEVGIVNSITYADGKYVISLRIPVINNFTESSSEEGIVLSGSNLNALNPIYTATNTSINSLLVVGNHIVGAGYVYSSQRQAIILVLEH